MCLCVLFLFLFFTFCYFYFLNLYYGFDYVKVVSSHCKISNNAEVYEFKSKSTPLILPQFCTPKVNC